MASQTPYGTGTTGDTTTSAKIDRFADQAGAKMHDIADQAGHIAHRVADQSREASDKVQEVAGNFKTAVDKSLKDQPMATLVMAGLLGFVLGAIWKS
jgi:ElaB/YqjD/DUF883 family membrane-anchored ribosome-binding protein